jgi:hypothetical protein
MKPDCYIGIKPCGCKVAWASSAPEFTQEAADTISGWIRAGYRIEPAVTDEVRDQLGRCKCQLELDL